MRRFYKYTAFILALTFVIAGCNEDELIQERLDNNPLPGEGETVVASSGTADFSTYVSLGNSLTAGLMDAALYNRGQQSSFPNLLAGKFAEAGGGAFNLPDINAVNGFNVSLNNVANAFDPSAATFGRFFLDLSARAPAPTTPGDALTPYAGDNSTVNNLGVPGMRLVELTANGYGQLNPFYTRFALDASSTSVLEQAIARQPTFMTFWLGNNDALSWATGGGVGAKGIDENGNPDPTFDAIPNTLVSTASFNASLDGSLAALYGNLPNLKGVILNVPNITVIPFFQAVRYNAVPLDEATASVVNAGYAGYNAILQAIVDNGLGLTQQEADMRQISFAAGGNAAVVVDDALTDISGSLDILQGIGAISAEQRAALQPYVQARQLKSAADMPSLAAFGLPAEILTLSAATQLGTLADPNNPASVIGVGVPLADNFTLTADEIALVLTRIGAFNAKIAAVADSNPNLTMFDANAFFTGIAVNGGYTTASGFTYAPDFSPNGVFSTDGIHPNPVGHAILANQVMGAIEAAYGATLPRYDVTEFTTVLAN